MSDQIHSLDDPKLKDELKKLRGHFQGTRSSVAKLLNVIETTLINDQGTDLPSLGATHYYSALVSTLGSIDQSKVENQKIDHLQTEFDILHLLAIVVHSLPKPVLKRESTSILELIQPRLDQFVHRNPSDTNTDNDLPENRSVALRSIISILEPIYLSFSSPELKSLKLQSIAQPIYLRSILPLVLAPQPKLRRVAQSLIFQTVSRPPIPLLVHPYLPHVIQFTLDQLERLISTYSSQPELSNTLLISLIKFIQLILPRFPLDRLDRLVSTLLSSLPKLGNPFLATTVFNTIESLFGPSTQLDQNRIVSTLTSILKLETSNPVSMAAKLNTLEHGWICFARIAPDACSQELPKLAQFADLFENLGNPDMNVREASMSLLSAICRYCLTDQEIHEASQIDHQTSKLENHRATSVQLIRNLTLNGLGSSEIIAVGGTVQLISIVKSLAIRSRNRPQGEHPDCLPYAGRLLKDHILALDKLRSTRIGLQSVIDETLGCISEICGPAFLLDVLPLNLNLDEDDPQDLQGRAWLLTVIKVFNSSLGHFVSYFVPLGEKLFEKKRNALKLSNNKQTPPKLKEKCLLKVKICDTLIGQIWRLLPGYCDVPWDLEVAFDRSFAELLAQIIYSQPTLRPPIFNSLKILIDKTLTLVQRSLPTGADHKTSHPQEIIGPESSSKNEFGFNAQSHLNHLKSFAANFLSVLFNVYNSSYEANKNSANDQKGTNSNRGYMVDCMRSILEIIPAKELNDSYEKIKNILNQSINAKSQSAVTIQKMLDLLIVLLPQLVSSSTAHQPDRLREIQSCIIQDVFLLSGDSNIQKKSYKLLTTFTQLIYQQGKVDAIEDVSYLIEKLIGVETTGKVSGPAKRDRALLISELVSIIPSDKLHLIPKLLTEVILGCKESNSEVRLVSYEGLIKIGKKMKEHGGKVNWKALVGETEEDEEAMKDVDQEATIEEYFKMISAGLAGTSPHMISSTIAALSRVLFEFHNELDRSTIEELIPTIEIFLNSSNREIAKTAIGFMKVAVVSLPKEIVLNQLDQIIPGLLKWANEHKNYFKSNIQNLLERLLRKFGFEVLEKFVVDRDENDGGRKLVYSLNKKQKKKRKQQEACKSSDPKNDEPDADHQPNKTRLCDAFEEALYGGDSTSADESTDETKSKGKRHLKKTQKPLDNNLLEDDEDEIMNLLDGGRMSNRAMAGKLAQVEKRKQELKKIESRYKKDASTGKMIIEADESDRSLDDNKKKLKELNSTNAYLEAINGEDSFKRDARGNVKFNKKRKQPQAHLKDDQELIEEGVSSFHLDNPSVPEDTNQKNKKPKRVKEHLGSEFKAKKAGGDRVSKDGKGVTPFAYLPLSSMNSKKKKIQISKNLNITGKTKGSKS